jgi:hypothetical protein
LRKERGAHGFHRDFLFVLMLIPIIFKPFVFQWVQAWCCVESGDGLSCVFDVFGMVSIDSRGWEGAYSHRTSWVTAKKGKVGNAEARGGELQGCDASSALLPIIIDCIA